jgi:hypothetical protein
MHLTEAIIHNTFFRSNTLEPKFKIGQKVTIRKPESDLSALRDSTISKYADRTGVVTNYYFISPRWGEVFYLYTVQIGQGQKDITLHEDEIK